MKHDKAQTYDSLVRLKQAFSVQSRLSSDLFCLQLSSVFNPSRAVRPSSLTSIIEKQYWIFSLLYYVSKQRAYDPSLMRFVRMAVVLTHPR